MLTQSLTRPLVRKIHRAQLTSIRYRDFDPTSLGPYVLFDSRESMLTDSEASAGFLDSVAVLKNVATGSSAGGNATQTTATKQPRALPLIKDANGELGGYLYIPDVSGNYAEGPSVTIGSNETWEGEVDMVITQWGAYIMPMGGGVWNTGFGLIFYPDEDVRVFSKGTGSGGRQPSGVTLGVPFKAKYGFDGTDLYVDIDDSRVYSTTAPSQSASFTLPVELAQTTLTKQGNYAINRAKLTVAGSVVFECDFRNSSIRHGDTAFECATGQVVTINQSGNDPATVVKKSVLRFDGVDDFMDGVFGQTIDGGYMFAAFSVLGNGGESSSRVFSVNSTGAFDWQSGGVIFSGQNATSGKLAQYIGGWRANHVGLFEDDNGDILHESFIESGNQVSRVNNADEASNSITHTISAEEFNIGGDSNGNSSPCIDLEYLALFPASITDSQADAVRNYINNRNIFYRWDTDGYYFYDPLSLSDGAVLSWNGRIVGSDNGDADLLVTQSTSADQPVKSGMVVTFADNTDHLDGNFSQEGWQIVGTSFGTLAYKLTGGGTSEIGTLGNLGYTRVVGDLYGVMLLPSNATNRDINEARRLLIDRGAADSVTLTNASHAWRTRKITEFRATMPVTTNLGSAWRDCSALTRFSTQLPQAATCSYAWYNNNSLSSFTTTDIKNCSNFASAWQVCSSLTQFPSGAKLGTEASNVNFVQAWRNSGLTSFNTPLPTAGDLYLAWYGCQSLTSFDSSLPSTSRVKHAWYGCTSLTDFSAGVFDNWNPSSIQNQVFWGAWDNCTSLTAQSVENILTSIATSGKYATSTGLSGGSALSDAVIDIDYDVSTGSLTAATTSAITTLKARGWGININNVLQ